MTLPIVLASSLLAVALVVALAREVRLRRALQRLLSRLLIHWRKHDTEDRPILPVDGDAPRTASRDRL